MARKQPKAVKMAQDDANEMESLARELCSEDAMQRMANNPRCVPCVPYDTWQQYEDRNWARFANEAHDLLTCAYIAAERP